MKTKEEIEEKSNVTNDFIVEGPNSKQSYYSGAMDALEWVLGNEDVLELTNADELFKK